ncbi:unnamed protein product [Aphanomyces euteiches]
MASEDGESGVVQDLHFLFASDEELRVDLAYVCSLLESPESTTVALAKTSKTISHQDRRKQEILVLRRQVDILKAKLLELQHQATAKPDMTVWERAARNQSYACGKALSENEQLRSNIEQNAFFIQELVYTLQKKPRLTSNVDSEEWRAFKLVAQKSLRIAAIHAIADHQFNQLQTAMIKAGIYGCHDDIIRYELVQMPDRRIMPERIYQVTLSAPFRTIGAAVWKVFNGEHPMRLPEGAEETLEAIDPHTVYQTFHNTSKSISVHSNMIYKYYVEVDREVIVWRSVLEDALMPHMNEGEVHNRWGWCACRIQIKTAHISCRLVVAPTSNSTACRVTYIHQMLPLNRDERPAFAECVERKKMIAAKYAFGQAPEIPGTFPGRAVNEAMDFPIPFEKRTLLDRDKEMEWTLKHVIDKAVVDFARSNPSAR